MQPTVDDIAGSFVQRELSAVLTEGLLMQLSVDAIQRYALINP